MSLKEKMLTKPSSARQPSVNVGESEGVISVPALSLRPPPVHQTMPLFYLMAMQVD